MSFETQLNPRGFLFLLKNVKNVGKNQSICLWAEIAKKA